MFDTNTLMSLLFNTREKKLPIIPFWKKQNRTVPFSYNSYFRLTAREKDYVSLIDTYAHKQRVVTIGSCGLIF